MLQIAAEPFGLEGGPEDVLVHGVRVLGPRWKLIRIVRELVLHVLDGLGVFVEEDL